MKPFTTVKVLLTAFLLFLSANTIMAQENAERLELSAIEKQQVMTIASQREAIKLFTAAKLAFTSDAGKQRCDNGIAICNRNINSIINARKEKDAEEERLKEEERKRLEEEKNKAIQDSIANASVKTYDNVNLELSESRIDFKGLTKKNDPQIVDVNCNYSDWEIVSEDVNWLSVKKGQNFLMIEAKVNEGEERSHVVEIQCGDKNVKLVVNQDKMSLIDKKRPKKKANYNY